MGLSKTAHTLAHLLDSGAPLTQAEGRNGSSSMDCMLPTSSPPPADKLDLILQEICESRAATDHRIGTIATDLGILEDNHKNLTTKVRSVDGTLTDLASQHTWNINTIFELQRRIQQLHNRPEDADGCVRRNNMRIIGIPEGGEGTNPSQFIEEWFCSAVAPHGLLTIFVVERAHSVPPC
ncbi:hypothetical protein NDU88_001960 [Pleurodeles waltl]|uniref:Uncharacterized protein n=1 Tax=Pleurodeles waltl TaxID=8319 RepID=A0AAV7SBB6_PLEWA|nr:hypothetical protein NDU88_001960 [Pleurodeles waltl]